MFLNLFCFKNTADTVQGWQWTNRFRFRNPCHPAIHRENYRQHQMGRAEQKCGLRLVQKSIVTLKDEHTVVCLLGGGQ